MTVARPKCVLLDRDGVLNEDLPNGVVSVDELRLVPRAAAAVASLTSASFSVLVVTNQSAVGRGMLRMEELDRIHGALSKRLSVYGGRIDAFFVCPHAPTDECSCRKPQAGLIETAQKQFGFVTEETWMVGDDLRDVAAARAAGCRPAMVRTGKGARFAAPDDVVVFDDIEDFARHVIAQERT